jgi:hypothetical protein
MLPVAVNGDATVTVVEPATVPDVDVIVAVPGEMPVARPLPFTAATPVADDVQETPAVRTCELLSLYVPVAVNCCVAPGRMEALTGVTTIDTRVGAVTVSVVEAVTDPEAAPIIVLPCPSVVARPEVLIVAIPVFDEVHVTELVISCVVPSV